MATRVRQSAAGPSSQRRPGNEAPPYEKTSFSLNPAAQRALAQLNHTHSLRKLDESLKEAQGALSNSAAEINDRLSAKEKWTEKRKNELASEDGESGAGDDLEQRLDHLRDRVNRMTQRMDESMRKMIDAQHSAQSVKTSLAASADGARINASTQASTQNVRSQRQTRRESGVENDEDGDEEEEYQDFTPTDPTGGTQAVPSPLETFQGKVEDAKTRYQSYSLTARYADNNDYRNFRSVVHDAQHPDDDVPLSHHTEWFPESGAPAPGITTRARADVGEEDDDDDIAISRAKISTKCPLTLQEFTTPLTSKKCPHSFESEAILSMIKSNRAEGGRSVRCPVSGCSQILTPADLHTDKVLIRKIKRIQRAKELEEEDMEIDGDSNGRIRQTPTVIDDADEDGADVDDTVEGRVVPQTQMKAEPKNTATQRPPPSTMPRSSAAVVDLGGGSTDEEAEEDDDMEE